MAMTEAPVPMMGKFPVVLSDALMGRSSKEVFTGIKYLTPPPPAESTTSALLKPSTSDLSKFNLTLSTPTTTSYYHGSRADGKRRGQGKYVLVFDDARQAFVLHQLDSEFEMGFVRVDDETRKAAPPAGPPDKAPPAKAPPKGRKKSTAPPKKEENMKPDTQPPKRQKTTATPAVARKRKEPTPEPESEEDSDDGLTIEYPGGKPPGRAKGFSRAPPPAPEVGGYRPRSPDLTFGSAASGRDDNGGYGGDGQESEEDAEEGEGEGEGHGDIEHFDLGSPVGHGNARHESGSEEDDDVELDLEAELERELAKGEGESSESEEE